MSDSEVSDETSPEREIVSRQSGYRQTSRDYPPESELIATLGGGKSSTVRLLFRGKVISSASFEVLVSSRQSMLSSFHELRAETI